MRQLLLAVRLGAILIAVPLAAHSAEQPSGAITIAGPSSESVAIDTDSLARLSTQQIAISFLSAQGNRSATFAGPLLWNVLEQYKAIDPAQHQAQVSQYVVLTGRDGYRAVLALAELAPEYEGKQIILAREMDGKPLASEHLRIVVPADKRGGRSVRDIARIEVKSLP